MTTPMTTRTIASTSSASTWSRTTRASGHGVGSSRGVFSHRHRWRTEAVHEDASAEILANRALEMIEDDDVIGLSRGEHCAELARRLGERRREGLAPRNVRVVPLEAIAAKECAVHGLEVRSIDEAPAIMKTFAQPSECALAEVNGKTSIAAIFGRETTPVQPDIARVKAALKKSLKVVLLKELVMDRIGGSIPLVVDAENWEEHAEELDDLFLGDAEVWRRGANFDSNPRGGSNPYVSADGSHTLLDLRFEDPINGGRWECGLMLDGEPCGPYELQYALENDVSGVSAHGIYTQADAVITINPESMEAVIISRDE